MLIFAISLERVVQERRFEDWKEVHATQSDETSYNYDPAYSQ